MNQVVMITGPASTDKNGWLKPAYPFAVKAHFFEQEQSVPDDDGGHSFAWRSLCGVDAYSSRQVPMFEAGIWTRCKKCEQQMARRAAA
ncbi:hypothetical protein [Pseudomonas putida]|uniref:hypothetical protein n=1 Tax=Pseudomonas putida TaxID=303 RepID=UPI0023651C6C|nr:hypothetical protein [Pseudomonas putida]MDD2046125.1 hypothetical protein [Pseudomonas putida]